MSLLDRLTAFVDFLWTVFSTLVRSFFALFSFRRSSDLFALSTIDRDPLAKAHARLRPILLTPRSIARSSTHYAQRAISTRTHTPDPQRTSLNDPELGLSVPATYGAEPLGTSATSFPGGTPDTSLPTTHTTSLSVLPLTPPDKCYLPPMPSVTGCPYTEPWPTSVALDRSKPRLAGSPLKLAMINGPPFPEPMVGPIGSPPHGRWSPVQVWTSTPCKGTLEVPDPALSPFDPPIASTLGPSPALANISHALVLRSQSSFQPYDDTSTSNTSSDASFSAAADSPIAQLQPNPTREPYQSHPQAQPKNEPYPRFHYPDAYAFAWRRHGLRVPGRRNHAGTHPYASLHSRTDLPTHDGWYDTEVYTRSPVALSSPRCDFATEDEDEDEDNMPLGRLKACLTRRARTAALRLDIPAGAVDVHKSAAGLSPRTRRMSEGCLLVLSESTPTRVGVGVYAGRHPLSLALDGDGCDPKDWLEVLSLRPSSEKGAIALGSESCLALSSPDGIAG